MYKNNKKIIDEKRNPKSMPTFNFRKLLLY